MWWTGNADVLEGECIYLGEFMIADTPSVSNICTRCDKFGCLAGGRFSLVVSSPRHRDALSGIWCSVVASNPCETVAVDEISSRAVISHPCQRVTFDMIMFSSCCKQSSSNSSIRLHRRALGNKRHASTSCRGRHQLSLGCKSPVSNNIGACGLWLQ